MLEQDLPSPFATGIACRCPRCGQGPLFEGYLTTRRTCPACGLDLSFFEGSEGPAVFIILIGGVIIVAAAALTEIAFHPHPLVHLALWIPGTILLSLLLLRPGKAIMIALQYHHIVRETPRS